MTITTITARRKTKMLDAHKMKDEIETRFTYHTPKEGQLAKYDQLRTAGKVLAYLIVELTPDSREQSLALTHLEEAIMQANAAIARRE